MTKPISVALRLKPFSSTPGILIPLPPLLQAVQIFPTCYRLYDLTTSEPHLMKEESLPLQSPFLVTFDLEKKVVKVGKHSLFTFAPIMRARLSFGVHKKQNWESMKQRLDMRELWPFWFSLGMELNLPTLTSKQGGIYALLDECSALIAEKKNDQTMSAFKRLFKVGFSGLFCPRSFDEECQGIVPEGSSWTTATPFYLLQEGSRLMASCFVQHTERVLKVLPALPKELFCGRLVGFETPFGTLDIEWTKKEIRRMHLVAHQTTTFIPEFQSPLRQYRLRTSLKERGTQTLTKAPLTIQSGKRYFFDCFER